MSIRLKFALATIALAATAGANATSFASASFGPIQIQLFDLNPYDSVLPSIGFSNAGNIFTRAYAFDGQTKNYIYTSGTATAGAARITASVSGVNATSIQGAQASISGQASGGVGGEFGIYSGGVDIPELIPFTLSANTAVLFSTVATVTSGITVGRSPGMPTFEAASSVASFLISGSSGGVFQDDVDQIYVNVSNVAKQRSITKTLFAGVTNSSSSDMRGNVEARVSVYGYSSIAAAVPEPETYAMLLAGLGVIGAVARRRRASAV